MGGALGSGMDIVIELSAAYVERIVRKIYNKYKICHDGPFPGVGTVRNMIPVIHQVELSQGRRGVDINVTLRATYGEKQTDSGEWINIDPEENIVFPFPIQLGAATNVGGVAELQVSSIIFDILGESPDPIPIEIDFLTQRVTAPDGEEVDLWTAAARGAFLKVVHGNLLIGLDVELSQDIETLRSHGLRLRPDLEEAFTPHGNIDPRICLLPVQPTIEMDSFNTFADSFLNGHDWGMALDKHIVDAILRGKPSYGLNRRGPEPADCIQGGDLRFMCLELAKPDGLPDGFPPGLGEGVIGVKGEGSVFVCPETYVLGIDFARDDWYVICFEAVVTLRMWTSGLNANYELRGAHLCGSDEGSQDPAETLRTIERKIPELMRGEIAIGLSTTLGDASSALGQLRMNDVEVRPEGVVFRGEGLLRAPTSSIGVDSQLLFATDCDVDWAHAPFDPLERSLIISSHSEAPLHLCPLVINGEHAMSFSVISRTELQEGGTGLTLALRDSVNVRIRLNGEPGQYYSASLDIPNNAERSTVELIGNLRETRADLNPEELELRRTDYIALCTEEHPRPGSISRRASITNLGPGNLLICRILFAENPENPDGIPVFSYVPSSNLILAEGEVFNITVDFTPGESGIGRTYEGRIHIVTNAGRYNLALTGRLDRTTDWDSHGIAGSFGVTSFADAYGFFCGKVDWDNLRKSGGRIFDPEQSRELIPILGGEECCPPPHTPACQCIDFLEITLRDVPRNVRLTVLDEDKRAILNDRTQFPSRILMIPIKEDRDYALQAKVPRLANTGKSSPLTMRRWLVQQDSLYTTNQRLSDLTVFGEQAYVVGSKGIEAIRLTKLEEPSQIALVKASAGATSIAVFKRYLLVAGDKTLNVLSLADPKNPTKISSVNVRKGFKTLLTRRVNGQFLPFVYACGQELQVFDLLNPKKPKEISRVTTKVRANRALVQDNYVYLFGKGGLEVFDISKPNQPTALGLLPTKKEIRNAVLAGRLALLIYDSKQVDMVDISKPSKLRQTGNWQLESWMSEYVPIVGNVIRYKGYFLMLRGDQLGFRVMRIRRNRIDQEKLRERRGQSK